MPWIFGFLRVEEFTFNSPFDALLHLTPEDFPVDSRSNPTCLHTHIRCYKTDPCWQHCYIYLGLYNGSSLMCPVSTILAYLTQRGSSMGPYMYIHHQTMSTIRLCPPSEWLPTDKTVPFFIIAAHTLSHWDHWPQFLHWDSNFCSSERHPTPSH